MGRRMQGVKRRLVASQAEQRFLHQTLHSIHNQRSSSGTATESHGSHARLTGGGQQAERRAAGHRLLLLRGGAHDHLLTPGHLHLGGRLQCARRGGGGPLRHSEVRADGRRRRAAGGPRAAQPSISAASPCDVAPARVSAAGLTAMREVCRASMAAAVRCLRRWG